MVTLLLLVIYLAFISLGLPDSLLGAGWPAMHVFFGVPVGWAGIVSMLICGGTILSSLASDAVTGKLGTRMVTAASVLMTALALFGFSVSTKFWMICLWAIPYGLGAGSIDAALNNYVALHYSSRHMSWLHCFWGVGTIVSPYVMSFALAHRGWQMGYRWVSEIQLGIFLILLVTLPLWKVHGTGRPRTGEARKSPGLAGAIKIRGVPQLLSGFFCYCAAENTCMLWTASCLLNTRGVSPERAAAFASLFFIGITVGRFLSGFLSDRFGDRNMIRLGTGIVFLGILMTAFHALPVEAALIGFVVIGFGCAPIYPSIIHATPANFGPENSQTIIGVQMASAYMGATLVPPLFGLLSSFLGMRIMPWFLALFFTVMIVMTEKTFRMMEKQS